MEYEMNLNSKEQSNSLRSSEGSPHFKVVLNLSILSRGGQTHVCLLPKLSHSLNVNV